jgi:hypothetical protein
VQDRPAVVVAAVHVRPALEQQSDERRCTSGKAEQVVAVRAALPNELRMLAEQLAQRLLVTRFERPVGEDER